MIQPTDLKTGQRVRIWITGMIGDYEATVTDGRDTYGWPILSVADWPPLKHEDYIVRAVLEEAK